MKHILIVGQGLAGSALAFRLNKQNIPFTVVDPGEAVTSSRIAAGLMNPVVFKRLNPVNKAVECMTTARDLYRYAEAVTGSSFFYPLYLFKPIHPEIKPLFYKKSLALQAFMDERLHENPCPDFWRKKEDYIRINGAYLNTLSYLDATRTWLLNNDRLIRESFDPALCHNDEGEINYNGKSYSDVVFCKGYCKNHPFFDEPFFNPVKGEVLTIKLKDYPTDSILVDEQYLVPTSQGLFKLGATYDWDNLNKVPTDEAKEFLLKKCEELISIEPELVAHNAAVRPSTDDRSPVVGKSIHGKNIWILNGLGTRGALLSPHVSQILTNCMIHDEPIPHQYDVARFRK